MKYLFYYIPPAPQKKKKEGKWRGEFEFCDTNFTNLKVDGRNLIQVNDIAIIDAAVVEQYPVISPRESNWKRIYPCDEIPRNIANHLIRHRSERYMVIRISLWPLRNRREFKIKKFKKR